MYLLIFKGMGLVIFSRKSNLTSLTSINMYQIKTRDVDVYSCWKEDNVLGFYSGRSAGIRKNSDYTDVVMCCVVYMLAMWHIEVFAPMVQIRFFICPNYTYLSRMGGGAYPNKKSLQTAVLVHLNLSGSDSGRDDPVS